MGCRTSSQSLSSAVQAHHRWRLWFQRSSGRGSPRLGAARTPPWQAVPPARRAPARPRPSPRPATRKTSIAPPLAKTGLPTCQASQKLDFDRDRDPGERSGRRCGRCMSGRVQGWNEFCVREASLCDLCDLQGEGEPGGLHVEALAGLPRQAPRRAAPQELHQRSCPAGEKSA